MEERHLVNKHCINSLDLHLLPSRSRIQGIQSTCAQQTHIHTPTQLEYFITSHCLHRPCTDTSVQRSVWPTILRESFFNNEWPEFLQIKTRHSYFLVYIWFASSKANICRSTKTSFSSFFPHIVLTLIHKLQIRITKWLIRVFPSTPQARCQRKGKIL